MNRRSFMAGLAGVPIVGLGARLFGRPRPKAESGITVHGPEVIVVKTYGCDPMAVLSLRFENVPLWDSSTRVRFSRLASLGFRRAPGCFGPVSCRSPITPSTHPVGEVLNRLRPLFGTVNRSHWHWHGDIECARTSMFTDVGVSPLENGLCRVVCAFTPALARRPWPGSHRPVDFEKEILKALTAG